VAGSQPHIASTSIYKAPPPKKHPKIHVQIKIQTRDPRGPDYAASKTDPYQGYMVMESMNIFNLHKKTQTARNK
jgi:hypothetical protein